MTKDPFIPGIAELAYYDATDVVAVKMAAAPVKEQTTAQTKTAAMIAKMQAASLAGEARL